MYMNSTMKYCHTRLRKRNLAISSLGTSPSRQRDEGTGEARNQSKRCWRLMFDDHRKTTKLAIPTGRLLRPQSTLFQVRRYWCIDRRPPSEWLSLSQRFTVPLGTNSVYFIPCCHCVLACVLTFYTQTRLHSSTLYQQGVALTGRNSTRPPCSVSRPTAHAPGGRPARPPAELQTTTTDDRRQTPASKTILTHHAGQ